MGDDMDRLMARLATQAPERSLEGFEHRVLRGVARRRDDQALAPVRLASIGAALAIGVAAGGMAAATTLNAPRQFSPFSTSAHLAPSTLLEGLE